MLWAIGIISYLISSSFIVAGSPITNQAPFSSKDQSDLKPVLDDEFEGWLNEVGYRWGMTGVAIGVTRRTKDSDGRWNGWVTESKGYGVADRWGHAVDEDTLFGIGSNSKLFTALAIGMLVQDETYPLNWDTKIKDVIPDGEWMLQDPSMEQNATLVDILSHRTGLPRHDLSYSRSDTTRSVVMNLRYLRPSAESRQVYQYNNQMFTTAAYIVELLTNKTVQEFVTDKILKPLGMDASTYIYDEAMVGHGLADGFVVPIGEEGSGDKPVYKPIPYFDMRGNTSLIAGAGGVISNVKDVTRWLQTLLLMGRHPITNEQVIPAAAIAKAAEGVSVVTPLPDDPSVSPMIYGLGQSSFSYQGHYIVEHNGATVGHYTLISRAPYDGIGITVLTNTLPLDGRTVLPELVKWRLYEKALNLKYIDWESKIPIPKETPPPKSQTPLPLPLHSYTGTYSNPAYGKIILCPFRQQDDIDISPLYQSHCHAVVSEILEAYNTSNARSQFQPDLVFSWDKFWSTHILISHHSKNTFTARSIMIFPPPFPESDSEPGDGDQDSDRDSKPFANDRMVNGSATFVVSSDGGEVVSGIAMKGVWGAGKGVKELDGTSEESAEVWFDRIGGL